MTKGGSRATVEIDTGRISVKAKAMARIEDVYLTNRSAMNVRLESTARVGRVEKRGVEGVSKERVPGGEKVVWVWCESGVDKDKDKQNIGIWLFQDVGHRPDLGSLPRTLPRTLPSDLGMG